MPYDHIIVPGDHIVRLAYTQGMRDPLMIWNDPGNAKLRQRRADPAVLGPADVVHVPDGPPWVFEGLQTGREHTVVVDLAVARVRISLRHPGWKPRAGKPLRVVMDGETKDFETDADGVVEIEIGPFTAEIEIEIDNQRYRLAIARLEPGDTSVGVRQRLANLGYDAGPSSGEADGYLFRSAVEEFQRDQGLDVDGIPGGATQARLIQAHGA